MSGRSQKQEPKQNTSVLFLFVVEDTGEVLTTIVVQYWLAGPRSFLNAQNKRLQRRDVMCRASIFTYLTSAAIWDRKVYVSS
jgi:hypothetical protein